MNVVNEPFTNIKGDNVSFLYRY